MLTVLLALGLLVFAVGEIPVLRAAGETPAFDAAWKQRFAWGGVELRLRLRDAHITEAAVYTDAMDTALADAVTERLRGRAYDPHSILEAFADGGDMLRELGAWLAGEIES